MCVCDDVDTHITIIQFGMILNTKEISERSAIVFWKFLGHHAGTTFTLVCMTFHSHQCELREYKFINY